MCNRIFGVAFVLLFLAVGQLQAAITAVSLGTGASVNACRYPDDGRSNGQSGD